jgi:DNA helicase-2/ATP-dependent DNA helicase PcrA
VVQTIQDLIREGVSPGQCAVMYRTNAQSRALEDAFLAEGMPYKLVGATRFYARREIKDLMAYMRIIHNPYDTVSLNRIINVPSRQIGSKTLAGLVDWAARREVPLYDALHDLAQGADAPIYTAGKNALVQFYEMWREWIAQRDQVSVLELLDQVIEETGYGAYLRDGSQEGEDRWENVLELRSVASEYSHLPLDEALLTFLEEISLVSDVDNLDETEAPTLLTLHSAKGLEFETVFIVGLNDGLLPHSRCFDNPDEMEEERRLFYVGVTRAKSRLYLSHTFRRTIYGSSELGAPSRFLSDIPSKLKMSAAGPRPQQSHMRFGRPRREASARERRTRTTVEAPLRTGDAVRHPTFGEGTVIEIKQRGADWDVTVAFKRRGIKTLAASFANLEKVE